MAMRYIPRREEIPSKYKWNAESLFISWDAWRAELERLQDTLDVLVAYRGRIVEGPEVLAGLFDVIGMLIDRIGKVYTYASLSHAVDMRDQVAARAVNRARGLFGQFMAAQAFLDPELLALGRTKLQAWMETEPRLSMLRHYVDDLFRQQAHVRSTDVEEMMGMLTDPFSGVSETASALTDADFVFVPAMASDGAEIEVTQGSLHKILSGPDREARRSAYEHYYDKYLEFKNTLATALVTSVKQNVFKARVRRYGSTLEMALSQHNIPMEVFHNLITVFREHLPIWHRYWAVRRKALGVDVLQPYDIWAPLTGTQSTIPFERAIDLIAEGLRPMGDAYVQTLRRGALEQRWVDVYPCQGKRSGAFSVGFQGTYPFITMSYNDDLFSLSTLAHELGHSMHSYLTWEHQPFLYSHYSLFVAEVASNFHQAMVRDYLLRTHQDTDFQINVVEEAMSNFYRYFFVMPTLARFELEVHRRVEQGRGLNAEGMIDLMADLFAEGYGEEMSFDRDRVGITWATFHHLYVDYYVYQYATGISGAHALARRVLDGVEGAVDDYLHFLEAGSSMYPLDALRMAGVDLTSPDPVRVTFGVLEEMVVRLETLLG